MHSRSEFSISNTSCLKLKYLFIHFLLFGYLCELFFIHKTIISSTAQPIEYYLAQYFISTFILVHVLKEY